MSCIEGIQLDGIEENGSGREITQELWIDLVEERVRFGGRVDLGDVLSSHGYSNIIREIRVSPAICCSIDVSNCYFVDCDMREANFSLSTFKNVMFSRCALEGSIFYKVKADRLTLQDCYLPYSCWNQAELNDFTIESSPFQRTWEVRSVIAGMTFVMAKVTGQSSIHNCSLSNVIFAGTQTEFSFVDCTPHIIDQPVIGIGFDPTDPAPYAQLEVLSIRKFGGIPVYYQHYPEEIDSNSLEEAAYRTLGDYPERCELSRAQWLLENRKGEHTIERVKKIAERYFPVFDGIVIPGGEDVPQILYKSERESVECWDDRYTSGPEEFVRSVMEFALLHLCVQEKKPVLGICRGGQITNVFLGGTLANIALKGGPLQLKNFSATKEFSSANSSSFSSFMKKIKKEEEVYALSLHHQAIDQLGATVVPLFFLDDIIKLSLAREGLFIASQVHPEVLMWEEENVFSRQRHLCEILKGWIEKIDEHYQSEPSKEKLERAFQTVLDFADLKNDDAEFFEFDLDNEDAGEALEPLASAYFEHEMDESDVYLFVVEHRELIMKCLDKEIKECERLEKKFHSMMKFAKHVFDLFFDTIGLALLDAEEQIA